MAQSKWWIGVLVASLGWASGAGAQSFVNVRAGSTSCTMAQTSVCVVGQPCGSGESQGMCRLSIGSLTYCHPRGALSCCTSTCDGGATCTALDGEFPGVCIPGDSFFCGEASGVSGQQLVDCHTSPDGELVAFGQGDCDGDGVSNAAELAAVVGASRGDQVRMVCSEPLRRGVVDGSQGCEELAPCEVPEEVCQLFDDSSDAGVCQITPDSRSLRCTPARDSMLYCSDVEGDHYECLTADNGFSPARELSVGFNGDDYCVPPLCAAQAVLAECIRAPFAADSDPPVPFYAGDCDGDGVANSDEPTEGAICVSNSTTDAGPVDAGPIDPNSDAGPIDPALDGGAAEDAGTPSPDAGTPSADAGGVRVDGGDVDAGPGTPSFSGGGGCACRAGSSRAPLRGAPALALLALLALVARRRVSAAGL